MQPKNFNRIRGLDGLRGVAAFAVILHHSAIKGTDIGGLSVFTFFILSGYLITGILHRARLKIEAGIGTIGAYLKDFWLQRALRIFPAYYLWLSLFLIIDPIYFGSKTLQDWPWYVFYVQNFSISFIRDRWIEFSHTWSLAVEQQYYVFFAPLLLLLPTRLHLRFLWGAILVCVLTSVWFSFNHMGAIASYIMPSNGFMFMAAGAVIAIQRPTKMPYIPEKLSVTLALILLGFLIMYPVLDRAKWLHLPYADISIASVFSLSILMIWVLNNGNSAVVNALETRPFTFLGLVSYGLYIVHLPVGFLVEHFVKLDTFGARLGISADIAEFLLVFPVSLVLATASYFLFEKKFLDLKARLRG
jgi:peptidoglycan/LPS O-acetylase OafA/YrhL